MLDAGGTSSIHKWSSALSSHTYNVHTVPVKAKIGLTNNDRAGQSDCTVLLVNVFSNSSSISRHSKVASRLIKVPKE